MTIYLDNCCFNRPFDDQSQVRVLLETEAKLAIQDQIRSGKLRLVWSYILDFENEANPFEDRRISISAWQKLAAIDISESDGIVSRAETLFQFGFKAKDALHLACAIEARCDVFLTTDKGIVNKAAMVPELAITNPVDYDFTANDD